MRFFVEDAKRSGMRRAGERNGLIQREKNDKKEVSHRGVGGEDENLFPARSGGCGGGGGGASRASSAARLGPAAAPRRAPAAALCRRRRCAPFLLLRSRLRFNINHHRFCLRALAAAAATLAVRGSGCLRGLRRGIRGHDPARLNGHGRHLPELLLPLSEKRGNHLVVAPRNQRPVSARVRAVSGHGRPPFTPRAQRREAPAEAAVRAEEGREGSLQRLGGGGAGGLAAGRLGGEERRRREKGVWRQMHRAEAMQGARRFFLCPEQGKRGAKQHETTAVGRGQVWLSKESNTTQHDTTQHKRTRWARSTFTQPSGSTTNGLPASCRAHADSKNTQQCPTRGQLLGAQRIKTKASQVRGVAQARFCAPRGSRPGPRAPATARGTPPWPPERGRR